jgi:hypothetical protein
MTNLISLIGGWRFHTAAAAGAATAVFVASIEVSYAQNQTASPPATSPAAVEPSPLTPAASPSSEVAHPRLAPKDVFFLMERVSVKTKSGVIGFAPGTRVKFIKDQGETLLVQSEGTELGVRGDQLTNDLDLADLLGRQDAQSQQALQRELQNRNDDHQKETEKKNQLSKEQLDELLGKYAAEPTPKSEYKNPLDRAPYNEKKAVPDWWRPWMGHYNAHHYHK